MILEAKRHAKQEGTGLKILSHKQMLQRLPIALAQIKAGSNSESLLNEIRQIVYSLYRSKEITKKVYNNIIKYKIQNGFKRVINWNKYLSKPELLAQNPNLNHLVEPGFQGVNILFVLAFENDTQRTSHSGFYLPNAEIKNYVVISGENFFDQAIKNSKVTYENIRKIATVQGDDYTTGCLLDYPYFKDNYKMIAVDLSKQQALDADPRAVQQINFTAI